MAITLTVDQDSLFTWTEEDEFCYSEKAPLDVVDILEVKSRRFRWDFLATTVVHIRSLQSLFFVLIEDWEK